jgi:phage tail sheath protein FI
MPIPLTYPGVYIEEVPSGVRTIMGVPTSIAAFVGRTPRGPIDEPQTIFNYGDFANQFGELTDGYPLSFAVRDFFANGGGQAIVVRAFNGAPATSSVTFTLPPVASPLVLSISEPGTWARVLRVQTNRAEIDTDPVTNDLAKSLGLDTNTQLFNLQVTRDGEVLETIRNLTFAAGSRNVADALLRESAYLRVSGSAPAASTSSPWKMWQRSCGCLKKARVG